MKLLLSGQGFLGKDEALIKRDELELDYWDFSRDPIDIIISSDIEHLSSEFVFLFLKRTVYRCYDKEIPFMCNNPRDLTNPETGGFPLSVGPYALRLDESNEYMIHHIRNAMCAWHLYWDRDRRLANKSMDSKSPLAMKP